VFVDVNLGTYNIQYDKIEAAISDRTKAIFIAHTMGNPFNLDAVMEIAEKYDLWVIEDNCDALGSKYNGRFTGTFGHIATFSFYPPHHITMGEGGALVTNDMQLKKLIESFRDWGRDCWCGPGCDNSCGKRFEMQLGELPYGYDHKYTYSHIGYNLKVTDMQAAVGVEQLKKLPSFIQARKKNFELLYDGLKKYEKYFILPKTEPEADPSWFGFILTVREDAGFNREDIVKHLEINNVATRMLFAGNIIRHPSFKDVEYKTSGNLLNTDRIMNDTFWIGVYPGLTGEMIAYMVKIFDDFIKDL
jgi:CDP-6-deoxy-D-xylo-4-hexulose-3-dehydrase